MAKVIYSLRIEEDKIHRLRIHCLLNHLRANAVLEKLIDKYLEENEKTEGN